MMPRLSQRLPRMCRYAGDKARVKINGKSHYLGKWGSREAEDDYRRVIGQWRAAQRVNQTPIEARALVSELAADYIVHLREYYEEGKGEWYILPGRLGGLGRNIRDRSRLRYLCDTQ